MSYVAGSSLPPGVARIVAAAESLFAARSMQEHVDAMAKLDRCGVAAGDLHSTHARTHVRCTDHPNDSRARPHGARAHAPVSSTLPACRHIHWEAPIISLEGREPMRCAIYMAKSIAFLQLQPGVVAVRACASRGLRRVRAHTRMMAVCADDARLFAGVPCWL